MNAPSPHGIGAYYLIRQKRPARYWKDPAVAEWYPDWYVQKRLPGEGLSMESGKKLVLDLARICPECLAVPDGQSPAAVRSGCRCQRPLRRFLEAWMTEWRKAWRRSVETGSLEALRAVGRAEVWTSLQEAGEVYLQRGPAGAAKTLARVKAILTEATGRKWEQVTWDVVTRRTVLDWAEMRQAYAERGWSQRREGTPEDAWGRLRLELAARRLPALDTRTVRRVNTTINTYVRELKAFVGQASRTKYLRGLELPPLTEVQEMTLGLPAPRGHVALEEGVMARILTDLEALRETDKPLWAVLQVLLRHGPRPIELAAMQTDWLEDRGGRTVIALRNRPGVLMLKAGAKAVERDLEVPPEVLEVLREIARPGGSLWGCATKFEAEGLARRRASAWVRERLPEGERKHTLYLFRHHSGAMRYTLHGKEAAAAGLGHAPGSTATGRYVAYKGAVAALTDEELRGGVKVDP